MKRIIKQQTLRTPSSSPDNRGAARLATCLFTAALFAALLWLAHLPLAPTPAHATSQQGGASAQPSVAPAALVALIDGCSPEAIAAAGGNGATLQSLHAALEIEGEALGALAQARAQWDAIRGDHARAVEAARLGGAARAAARAGTASQLAAAEAAYHAARAEVRDLAQAHLTQTLGAEAWTLAQRFDANRDRRVPIEFRALDLSEEGWRTLERAVARESRGGVLTSAESAALAAARSSALAASLRARLEHNLAATNAAFTQTASTGAAP